MVARASSHFHFSTRFRLVSVVAHFNHVGINPLRSPPRNGHAELHDTRDPLPGAWRLEQQSESIGVMKIRLVGRMANGPVRKPIARLDDRREPDTEGSARVDGRQAIEPDKGIELKPAAGRAHGNMRAHPFVRKRTAVAIATEGEDGPFPRRSEVELMVGRLPFHRDEGFEAGVAPELCSDAWRTRRRDPNPVNISVEAEGHLEFSACRPPYEYLNGAHRLRACRSMALEVDPVFGGHNGRAGRGGIVPRPGYRVKLLAATFHGFKQMAATAEKRGGAFFSVLQGTKWFTGTPEDLAYRTKIIRQYETVIIDFSTLHMSCNLKTYQKLPCHLITHLR